MSSGFVSEAELQKQREARQKEWEKVRTEDQPIEAPEPEYDHRTLYDRLQEQKDKKQEEWEESRKFKNQIKNLDEDECSFLDLVDKTKIEQQSKINREENKELEEFRKAQASAEEAATEQRLKAEVQRPSAPPAARAAAAGSKRTQSQLMAGVVKKKARTNSAGDAAEKPAPAAASDAAEGKGDSEPPVGADETTPVPVPVEDGAVEYPSALECIGVLPGVGAYSDSSDSDSDASSDISWPKPKKMVVSSASTAESHKGHTNCTSNSKG
ncbi:PSME3-interacting protein-like [Amphibalanus amphitrite]|uniref:PSME3-interacting protein-like n=1 Tax=Amphibalanus amphitrite TaxID=1232801 RepID=UPI001C9207F5|nr:PSME3-interacting protein-like [Amphibalanus amphitrite]XP_043203670.1 PSME3-interacting protein-like [Amphibalanus amphitrite]XP_043203671.1 PSME3-interacting protein-like [Amphibalanus amphitrite]XP_043203672.1 PSME3-interacting protein-like [Amphibalanus amphitrite]XP_043203673.1 PSME3-interacting protein-like [Amphibalanus amphitrite]XP_043203674.1 PSME3-interacting protein-like [Amphibalanus amphitrite]XP_043203676.1 PSME3-interacting protein-like [Amphibalanus amphitrite]XP_04320367